MAVLTESQLLAIANAPADILNQAISELVLANPNFSIPTFTDFIDDLKKAKGNFASVIGRSHRPVSMEQFVRDKDFLGLDVVTDKSNKTTPQQGVFAKVLEAAVSIADGGYMEALLMGGIGCVDSKTEYLTPDGWRKISSYAGERVAEYDPVTQEINYVIPKEYIKLPCAEMWHFKTKYGIDQMLCDDHRVYYKAKKNWLFKSAKEVALMHNASTNGFRGSFQTTFKVPDYIGLELSDEDLRVMVMVIADGSFSRMSHACTVNIKRTDKIHRARILLKDSGIPWEEHKGAEGYVKFYFEAPLRVKSFKTFWQASSEQLVIICDECLRWDGSVTDQTFYTRNKDSADFIQYAFSTLGQRASLRGYLRDDGKTDYIVHKAKNALTSMAATPKSDILRVPSTDGFKYCFRVNTGLLVLRREGNIFITGNCGKTTLAQIVTLYDLYNLSTFKQPQLYLGMLPGSPVMVLCLNKTDSLAKRVTYGKLKNIIKRCPYFKEQFPYNRRKEEMMLFPHNLMIMYGAASADKFLGEDVISAIVDELNFMTFVEKSKRSKEETGEFDQAKEVYKKLIRRRASRFPDSDIGRFCMVSSKGHAGDFTEVRKKEVLAADNTEDTHKVFIWEKAHWEVYPDSTLETEQKFKVQVGDERAMTRILSTDETPRKGAEIMEVPVRYKQHFITDPEGALRDFGGRSARSSNVYFKDREDVWNMAKAWKALGMISPWKQTVTLFDDGMPEVTDDYATPWPECPRALHIDLALSQDRVGIACGFVLDVVPIQSSTIDSDGNLKLVEESFPYVVYDFALAVQPPKSGQINIDIIRHWVYYLRDVLKIPIQIVTMDNFQSVDTRQILVSKGFKTDKISVEDLVTYDALRSALHQKRVACPVNEIGFKELLALVPDFKKKPSKIDHPSSGPVTSKDVADAICGVYTVLLGQRVSWTEKEKVDSKTGRQKAERRKSVSRG